MLFSLGHLNQNELSFQIDHYVTADPIIEHLHNQLIAGIYGNVSRDPPEPGVAPWVSANDKPAVLSKPVSGDAAEQRLKTEVMRLPARDRRRLKEVPDVGHHRPAVTTCNFQKAPRLLDYHALNLFTSKIGRGLRQCFSLRYYLHERLSQRENDQTPRLSSCQRRWFKQNKYTILLQYQLRFCQNFFTDSSLDQTGTLKSASATPNLSPVRQASFPTPTRYKIAWYPFATNNHSQTALPPTAPSLWPPPRNSTSKPSLVKSLQRRDQTSQALQVPSQ